MATRTKPAARRAVKSAPTRKPTPKTEKSTHLRVGEYSKVHGGVFAGIFPGGKGKPDYRLFVPKDKSTLQFKGTFGPAEKIAGADSDTDGVANTKAMAAAGSEIAKKALSLKIDGHADYYIAAPREARAIAALAPEAFGATGWRWTSKQNRAWAGYAVVQYFVSGYQTSFHKSSSYGVAFVRRSPIQ